jgi:TetR/AcrR family transcriptional regulator, fatty acid metabolism regulator protein
MGSSENLQLATPYTKRGRGRPPIPQLREKILSSAAELFGKKEYHLVLTDEVAARAGVGKGSLYRQFASKEELYAAVVIEGFEQLLEQIRESLTHSASVRERVLTLVSHALNYFWQRRQFFTILRDPSALPRRQARKYFDQREEMSQLVTNLLEEGTASGEFRSSLNARIAAESLLGMLRGINFYRPDEVSLDEAVSSATAIFLDGCTGQSSQADGLDASAAK